MPGLPNSPAAVTPPAMHIPPTQAIQGSALEAASTKTLASNASLADTARNMGAGQKGSGRRKMRGGATPNLNAHLPVLPEGGTIKGVSAANNHLANVNNLNQLKTGAMYDKQMNAAPYDPQGGGRRTKKHRKARNGSSHNRRHRRRSTKSHSTHRRKRNVLLRKMGKSK